MWMVQSLLQGLWLAGRRVAIDLRAPPKFGRQVPQMKRLPAHEPLDCGGRQAAAESSGAEAPGGGEVDERWRNGVRRWAGG